MSRRDAMMRVVHLVEFDAKFIPQQIGFLNDQFPEVEQKFYTRGRISGYMPTAPSNVRELNLRSLIHFIADAHAADRLMLNGLFSWKTPLFFLILPWLARKGVWVLWGGDLYYDEALGSWKKRAIEWMRRRLIGSLYAIATPVAGDYEEAIRRFGGRAKNIDAGCNVFPFELNDLNRALSEKRRLRERMTDGAVVILLGNSADPTNEHIEMIDMLAPLADRDLVVHAALAYGDPDYVERVRVHGRTTFGDKFVPRTEFIPANDYIRYLAGVDIVIFNHRRPQGFGNMVIALYLGAKVFIRPEVSTWEYSRSQLGCTLFPTPAIPSLTYDELLTIDEDTRAQNRNGIAHFFDRDLQKKMWTRMLYD